MSGERLTHLDWVNGRAVDIDGSVWVLNSETVRGEGRWWYLDARPVWSKDTRHDLCTIGRHALLRRIEACRREHWATTEAQA